MTTPSFKIGELEVEGFSDGSLKTSLDMLVGMAREEAERVAGPTENGAMVIPVNNFVFRRGGRTIMIDAGSGDNLQPTLGKLPANLRAGGIDPASIDAVLLTHIHPDHANGLIDEAGAAIYPNAEILVSAQEHDFWTGPARAGESAKLAATRAQNIKNLAPYTERVKRMREGEEAMGCTPILAPGHTPGHTCWRVLAGRESFLAWGDIVHFSAVQISHPNTAVTYDLDPDMARQSRLRILDMVASEKIVVAGAHVNAPGFGRVARRGATFGFEAT